MVSKFSKFFSFLFLRLTFTNSLLLLSNFSIDGGVRRAADVMKAIALGATAVGIGRAFLYAYSAYGTEGVEAAINLLKDEMEMK